MTNTTTPLFAAAAIARASAEPSEKPTDLDAAFAGLEGYNYGSARGSLLVIDEAVTASLRDTTARAALEQRMTELLKRDIPIVAKEYVCGKLALIGSPQSVPALAELLDHKELGHAARTALEAMPCREAAQGLRENLPRVSGVFKVGLINSLGVRPDPENTSALAALLGDSEPQIAEAAAAALGEIGTVAAAQALAKSQPKAPERTRQSIADARLACAERLLKAGNKSDALAAYKSLIEPQHSKQVQLAARQGQLRVLQQR